MRAKPKKPFLRASNRTLSRGGFIDPLTLAHLAPRASNLIFDHLSSPSVVGRRMAWLRVLGVVFVDLSSGGPVSWACCGHSWPTVRGCAQSPETCCARKPSRVLSR